MSTPIIPLEGERNRGFQKWVRVPLDDLPLIRPPRHHMLAHITGGLTNLYDIVKKNQEKEGSKEKDTQENGENKTQKEDSNSEAPLNNDLSKKDEDEGIGMKENEDGDNLDAEKSENAESEKEKEEVEKNEGDGKKDDEGGGKEKKNKEDEEEQEEEEEEEEEETTPYTDEDGEFTPESDMPMLADRYKFIKILARGQSAIIVKVKDTFNNKKEYAIKVLHRVYKPIGSQEADILLELHRADPWLHVPFARLVNQFLYGPHYCLVFESLSPTPLYTHYEQKDIRDAPGLPYIRELTVKLLTVMGFLYKQNVIHADLKPENILLRSDDDMRSIMVVDFGNALRNTEEELSLYYSDFELQTLLYRAPEVIFGMKFSLEVDMWSLGCLLAECYLGTPLFMGKSKKEILKQVTQLLGPFPKEFIEGEFSDEFSKYIGRPLSRFQRLENLRKRLNDCKDATFLMLIERLLTYIPDRRFTPFEAACHPFVACATPFLYLTPSPGYIRYPTIQLDMSTYPYCPELPDDDQEEDSEVVQCRKRLTALAPKSSRSQNGSDSNANGNKGQGNAHTSYYHITPPTQYRPRTPEQRIRHNSVVELEDESPVKEDKSESNKKETSSENNKDNNSNSNSDSSIKESPSKEKHKEPVGNSSDNKSSDNKSSDSKSSDKKSSDNKSSDKKSSEDKSSEKKSSDSKSNDVNAEKDGGPGAKTATRSDVKETLKSMGLRCEDFTISVYSREQAHAILRRQGVEVTPNNVQAIRDKARAAMQKNRQPQNRQPPNRQPQNRQQNFPQKPGNRPFPQQKVPRETLELSDESFYDSEEDLGDVSRFMEQSTKTSEDIAPTEETKAPPDDDDDDDDCMVLDEIPAPAPPPRPPPPKPVQQYQHSKGHYQQNKNLYQHSKMPQKMPNRGQQQRHMQHQQQQPRLPQQFQLMGTTVQVNRGSKRPVNNRSQGGGYGPPPKRANIRPMPGQQYYRKDQDDDSSEASVQDTLKRLKNYNISITCRRNTANMGGGGERLHSGESDIEDDEHYDSEEDMGDMSRFLQVQCEVDENRTADVAPRLLTLSAEDILNEEHPDVDEDAKDDEDYHPKKRRRSRSRQKGKSSQSRSRSSRSGHSLDSSIEEVQVQADMSMLDGSLSDDPAGDPLASPCEDMGEEEEEEEEEEKGGKDGTHQKKDAAKDVDNHKKSVDQEEEHDDGEDQDEAEERTQDEEPDEDPEEEPENDYLVGGVEEEQPTEEEDNAGDKEKKSDEGSDEKELESDQQEAADGSKGESTVTEEEQKAADDDEEIDEELEAQLLGDGGDEGDNGDEADDGTANDAEEEPEKGKDS